MNHYRLTFLDDDGFRYVRVYTHDFLDDSPESHGYVLAFEVVFLPDGL